MNFVQNQFSHSLKEINIWEVLKDHNIASMGQLLTKPQGELNQLVDILHPNFLRDLNAELWKSDEQNLSIDQESVNGYMSCYKNDIQVTL